MLIYVEAFAVWGAYSIITKYYLFKSVIFDHSIYSYIASAIVSGFFGALFLYIFNHDNFFSFAKIIEKKEKKTERGWRHKFLHTGKVLTVFLITILAGPLIGALTARLLLNKSITSYAAILLASILTAIVWVSIYHGAISFSGLDNIYGRR